VESRHALGHLADLRRRVNYLKPMRAGNPTFLIWIGDVAEFINTLCGAGSAESMRLATALRGAGANDAGEQATLRYLARLKEVDDILAEVERELRASGLA
jgi:hypothetical protein